MTLGDVEPCDDPIGWPEFTVTLRFYVSSDDPEVIERERRRVFERDWWVDAAAAPSQEEL